MIPTLITDKQTGAVLGVNAKRLSEMPFALLTNPPDNQVVVPANQSSDQIPLSVSGEGPAVITHFAANRTSDNALVMLQMQDGDSIQAMMNTAISLPTIFGTMGAGIQKSYPLDEALYIDEQRSIIATLTDFSGAQNTIGLAMHSARHTGWQTDPQLSRVRRRMEEKQYLSRPFWYTFDQGARLNVGAGATVQVPISIGQDHHFHWFSLSGTSTGTYVIDIVEANKGESVFNGPQSDHYQVPNTLVVGSAAFPFRFYEPVLLETRSQLEVIITDTSGAPNDIALTFGGRILALKFWS